jgi:hypothetical protein
VLRPPQTSHDGSELRVVKKAQRKQLRRAARRSGGNTPAGRQQQRLEKAEARQSKRLHRWIGKRRKKAT